MPLQSLNLRGLDAELIWQLKLEAAQRALTLRQWCLVKLRATEVPIPAQAGSSNTGVKEKQP